MDFELLSPFAGVKVIATGRGIRELQRLQRADGRGRWRKLKSIALIRIIATGQIRREEIHWYEAHGIGKREFKIKFTRRH